MIIDRTSGSETSEIMHCLKCDWVSLHSCNMKKQDDADLEVMISAQRCRWNAGPD